MVPTNFLQRLERLDSTFIAVRVQIEDSEHFLGQISVLEDVVCPQAAPLFVWDFFDKDTADLPKVAMHGGISADDGDDAREIRKTARGTAEILGRHFPKRVLVLK